MIHNNKKLVVIQEREKFDGKKEKTIIIKCKKCPNYEESFFKNNKCISCFLETIFNNKGKKFESLSLDSHVITRNQIEIFLEYFKRLKHIKNICDSIELRIQKDCLFREFKCKILPDSLSLFNLKDINIFNPIDLYVSIIMRYKKVNKKEIKDISCLKCQSITIKKLKSLLDILEGCRIIKDYKNFEEKYNIFPNYLKFYQNLFSLNLNYTSTKIEIDKKETIKKKEIIDVYYISNYDLFKILIYKVPNEYEKEYDIKLAFNSNAEKDFFNKVINDVKAHLNKFQINDLIDFEPLIHNYIGEAISYQKKKYNFTDIEQNKIAIYATLECINLVRLFPLLIDDFIEEIFFDSDSKPIYINHQKYGRCRTQIILNFGEIERIKTFIRLYSGQRLDYTNPSIKFVMKNNYFYCRFAIDIEPVHAFNISLDIRKLNKNIFTIQDLLKNRTLNPLITAFLYFNILRRSNITVTGETDTGKTTLINALDLLTPKEFRKIYVENAIESLNQDIFDKHQLKFKVDSFEDSTNIRYSKQNQIKKLLHRSPDIIFLGEILTEEEARALFHCLAAGLRGFQTIHANNIESLINRFIHHFKINRSCLNDLNLIVLMRKNNYERKLIQVAEIDYSEENRVIINPIFKYNPESNKWDSIEGESLFDTKSIKILRDYEKLNKETFWRYINIYKQIFEFLTNYKKISNDELVDFFHAVSYISKFPVEKLEQFWSEWKENLDFNATPS